MPSITSIQWTALPNGIAGNRLKVSVFISPRLTGDLKTTTLDKFPIFEEWPTTVARIQSQIQLRYGAAPLTPVARGPLPSLEHWKDLFKPATVVKSYAWDEYQKQLDEVHDRRAQTYEVMPVHDKLKASYAEIAVQNPINPPTDAKLNRSEFLGNIGFYGGIQASPQDPSPEQRIFQQINQSVKANKFMPKLQVRAAGGQVNAAEMRTSFALVKNFYARDEIMRIARTPTRRIPPMPPPPVPDFHEMLGSLGSYPYILRHLGLVIDLEFALPAGPAAQDIQVIAPLIAGATNVTPKTKVQANFLAQPKNIGGDIRNGMLNLRDNAYQVVKLDVDGAALNIIEFATNMQRQEHQRMLESERTTLAEFEANPAFADVCGQNPAAANIAQLQPVAISQKVAISQAMLAAVAKPKEEGLPALRSAGIAVVKSRRVEHVYSRLDRSAKLHTAHAKPATPPSTDPNMMLYAEDLFRGHVVDVFDSTANKWFSLCKRVGTYEFLDAPGKSIAGIQDEAFVQAAGVTNKADDGKDEHFIHEVIFRWTGWSLAVPKPGKALTNDSNIAGPADRPKLEKGLRLVANFKVPPGSLPKLRFGRKYRVRARIVDLAGNTVGFESPQALDANIATRDFTYTRYSPVSAPQMTLCAEPKPAESLHRLVIRSNFAGSPTEKTYEPDTQRYVAPPPSTEAMAEEHGRLDVSANMLTLGANKTYDVIKSRDRTLRDLDPTREKDVKGGEPPIIFAPGTLTSIPYLPDPLAAGALIRGLPAAGPRQNLSVPFGPAANTPTWYDYKPFRVKVVEGARNAEFDAAQRVLTVYLPKAEMLDDVFVSCVPHEGDLPAMGVLEWLEEWLAEQTNMTPAQKAAKRTEILGLARQGIHWMVTPYQRITLVHAVQQPLELPKFGAPRAVRGPGDTYALLSDSNLTVHGKSTMKLDMHGKWKEWVDEPDNPRAGHPKQVDRLAHAFDVPVMRYQTRLILSDQIRDGYRHEFHDTKHRKVAYTAIGTTRFQEYFSDKTLQPKDFQRNSIPAVVNVPNAARPEAPKVAYIVPSFDWAKGKSGTTISSKRSGGGLRVYLERPWYTSGEAEKLAVVLLGSNIAARPKIDPYVTFWGRDPIWKSAARNTELSPTDFPLISRDRNLQNFSLSQTAVQANPAFSLATRPQVKAQATPGLKSELQVQPADAKLSANVVALLLAQRNTLAELNDDPDFAVGVAPHDVFYDESRGLWYCDIDIKMPEAYFPFVRLALARYQPNSLPNCHLSRVVRAEFIQLTPERTMTIAPVPPTTSQFKVTHTGVTYDAPRKAAGRAFIMPQAGPNLIRVTVEQRRTDGGGNLGWVPVAGDPYELEFNFMQGNAAVHSAIVSIPGDPKDFRLVVQEFEMHFGGDDIMRPKPEGRLIYADAIEL